MTEPDSTGLLVPAATYRLQLNKAFDFAAAARLVPYLHRLGISHVYVSPYLAARAGSTHGYDIIDHNRINPELGGEEGLRSLDDTLARHGMGQILDFVPNHMGVARADNRWWLDVLEWGEASVHASFFDVDWQPQKPALSGKVLLPFLGESYGEALESGLLRLAFDAGQGAFSVWYHDHRFPICPAHYRTILAGCPARLAAAGLMEAATELERMLVSIRDLRSRANSAPRRAALRRRGNEIKQVLADLVVREPGVVPAIEETVAEFNGTAGDPRSFLALHRLLERQSYRLAFWRVAAHEINYRRFFDINELAGLRMETPELFEAAHALVFRLVAEGRIHGLRIDHLDGLYDPLAYTAALQQRTTALRPRHGPEDDAQPFYIAVEKILAPHEFLREDWPVAGTTGYDFCALVNGLFVDPAGEQTLSRTYARFIGRETDFDEVAYGCKKLIMEHALAGELEVLANELDRISEGSWRTRDFTLNGLRDGLSEVIACFPVYRTYVTAAGAKPEDRRDIDWAVGRARRRTPEVDPSIYEFIRAALTTDLVRTHPRLFSRRRVIRFAMRFQQYTGPVMAKAVEDTAFYRYNRLISLNEVGNDPRRFGVSPAAFHHQNRERLRRWPHAMLATASHDSKRGEDVRARINALSELGAEWSRRIRRWAVLNRRHKSTLDERPAPTPNDEYLIYQTLVGAWPSGLVGVADPGGNELAAFAARVVAYMTKAVREAKVESSWALPNEAYEAAVGAFVTAILSTARRNPFLADFVSFQERVARIGAINGLAQTALKLTAPGVPDLYQGTEIWDLNLVDPDNRRPVDYARRMALLHEMERESGPAPESLISDWPSGRIKFYLTARLLAARARQPALWRDGAYLALDASGTREAHLCAFARTADGSAAIVCVPRLVAPLMADGRLWPAAQDAWRDTVLVLPPDLAARDYRNLLDGTRMRPEPGPDGGRLALAVLLGRFPVAVLLSE